MTCKIQEAFSARKIATCFNNLHAARAHCSISCSTRSRHAIALAAAFPSTSSATHLPTFPPAHSLPQTPPSTLPPIFPHPILLPPRTFLHPLLRLPALPAHRFHTLSAAPSHWFAQKKKLWKAPATYARSVSFCLLLSPPCPFPPCPLSPSIPLPPQRAVVGQRSGVGRAGDCLMFPSAGVGLGQVKLQPEFETGAQNFLIHCRNDVRMVAQREQLRDHAHCERLVV